MWTETKRTRKGVKERGQMERWQRRGSKTRGEGADKEGWRLCKSERLEPHLNSACVSPALAECYRL